MKDRLIEAIERHIIEKEDLVVLALLAMLSEGKKPQYFDRKKDGVKLSKLLFLATFGEFDEHGKIISLRSEPRINMDFVIYLFGVMTSTLYDSIKRLEQARLLEVPLNDRARYIIHVSLEDIMSLLREREPELYKVLRTLYESYAGIEGRELTSLVNNLIGINNPEAKAIFFGVNVRRLLNFIRTIRQLKQEGRVVDV